MTIWRPMKTICISLPEELLIEIEEAAKDYWCNRSECIRRLLAESLSNRETGAVENLRKKDPLDPRLIDLDDN